MSAMPKTLIVLSLLCSTAWAVEPVPAAPALTTSTVTTNAAVTTEPNPVSTKPLTAEQIAKAKAEQDAKIKALVKDQAGRLKQLEQANLDALTQNQELQLKNDNLLVQVQVLQSERSAQMFLYGGATMGVGVLLGFLIASYIHTKRRRQW
ncbi:hypothetical protein IAE19_15195 [Acinetobacter sp. S40]|uniref:hypothetical protein n=1 Tax=unclassified Acinetobacter TaxID=196816 RepID=UPI00190B90F3|nr:MULTISPECIES: hypothetical protein [unclassified Acinetobacter]MBJ9986776.1 hypothetical protein [Acinetobacter sp. S40]MBK0065139.1 hypothetical protein [Acinetobacter sp. S55]MBK0068324.1 hypothetical protein [Acinetobacter sp. S54]